MGKVETVGVTNFWILRLMRATPFTAEAGDCRTWCCVGRFYELK